MSTVVCIVLLVLGYWSWTSLTNTSTETRYAVAPAQKGTLIVSITGTGQVSTSNQIDLKPKVSGDVTYVGVVDGQEVKAGMLIAKLDTTDAEKAVRDAEVNLGSAKIALQKLQEPPDALSLIQTENALAQANTDLQTAYTNGLNSVSNTFLDLPNVMTGLQDILYGTEISHGSQDNISAYTDSVKIYDDTVNQFKNDAATKYQAARSAYDQAFNDYKSTSRFSDTQTITSLVNEMYDTTKTIAESVKSAGDLLNFVKDRLTEHQLSIPSLLNTHLNSLGTYTSQTNSHLQDLFTNKNTITSSNLNVSAQTEALTKLKNGADPLDIQSQQLSVKQKENALLDAQTNLADYYIRAPFDGTIAKVDVKKFDPGSPSTVIATLITKQQLAQISLNEVDAAKIKVGQKATLKFDAVDGLTIAGEVASVDTIGTVSQGVVTYTVKIAFDTQDNRVKSGMSANAAIITDVRQDAILVPNNAVKSQGGTSYVEMFDQKLPDQGNQGALSAVPPRQQMVQVGLSNDTTTEITLGLHEGDQVVVRTITAQTVATQQAPSLFGGGGSRGGGGAVRIPTGR